MAQTTSTNTNFRLGSAKASFVRSSTTENYRLGIALSSGYDVVSTSVVSLSGNPISVYENDNEEKALAVYDIADSGIFSSLVISSKSYVYDGFRFSYIESGDNNIWNIVIGANDISIQSSFTVWKGVPIGLDSNDNWICSQKTGTVGEIRKIMFGGVPLTAIKVKEEDVWCLAFSDKVS